MTHIEQLEALAFADDRGPALAALLPGTAAHDYWRGVALQNEGRLGEVDAVLADWHERHADAQMEYERLSRRQTLLRAGADLEAAAEILRYEAGARLDDEPETVAAAQRLPARLDPATLDAGRLLREALAAGNDLTRVSDAALPALVAAGGDLGPGRVRELLRRIPRANVPGLVELVAGDLAERGSQGFGSLPVHAKLTLAQLESLASLRPALRGDNAWVSAVVQRMQPPAHVEWREGPPAEHLDALLAFANTLPASFNALRAQVLYHRLELDRREGRYDRARFLAYLALPRLASYGRPDALLHVPTDQVVRPGANPGAPARLDALPADDEPLVRDYLEHFLATEGPEAFANAFRTDWLAERLAAARLLAGAPDAERWAASLGPERLAALRDRVEIQWSPRNPRHFAADAPVALEVDLKNVPQLVVKVFRINALAYFLARGNDVDTGIDLDGMVAGDERAVASNAPPVRRARTVIDLPACARPGTYVVELIGNGRSSRALVRKGALRHAVRVGAAGPVIYVLDESGRLLRDARVWLGGREYAGGTREDGGITVPFSPRELHVPMLLVHGEVSQFGTLAHPAEAYAFSAGISLDRQSLVPGRAARVAVRPTLTVAGRPTTVDIIEDPEVELEVEDGAGTVSTKTERVSFRDDAETVVELRVPEGAVRVAVRARGRVRAQSTQTAVDLDDRAECAVNAIHAGERVDALYLARTAGGYVLSLLGKTGEPRAARAVAVTVQHSALSHALTTRLETDARGRIELGPLDDVTLLAAMPPDGGPQHWPLLAPRAVPSALEAVEGQDVTLPAPDDAARWGDASLVEMRPPRVPVRDVTAAHLALERGAFVLRGLPAGHYVLASRGLAGEVEVNVAPAQAAEAGWVAAGPTTREVTPAVPLVREVRVAGDGRSVEVSVTGASEETRVHVLATRFVPAPALPPGLDRAPPSPRAAAARAPLSQYVSGRDIGDEYRYVLERRHAPRRAGNLLEKPGLLLNPRSLRATSSAVQHAEGGEAYAAQSPAPRAAMSRGPGGRGGGAAKGGAPPEAFATFDFLPAPAVLVANLRPDADGLVRVPLADLGDAQSVRVVLVDPALTSTADLALPETPLRARDLRLRLALDPARHFAEDRRVEGAPAGTEVVVDDVRTGRVEVLDTLARAHQVLLGLGADPDALREFSFVTAWHALDDAAKRAKYSKYACHELHLFLHRKDPAFFARVVRPYLAEKREKSLVDRFLLGEDLASFTDPWALGRLNALERVLLGRALPAARGAVARWLGDAVDLLPRDPERDARLVDALLGAGALEAGGGGYGGGGRADGATFDAMPMEDQSTLTGGYPGAAPAPQGGFGPPAEFARLAAPAMPPPPPPPPAAAPMPVVNELMSIGGGGSDRRSRSKRDDVAERGLARQLYRGVDTTKEWAETQWWSDPAAVADPALVPANRFWRDLARHDDAAGPFLSPHFADCTASLADALGALAFLDLPFAAVPPDVSAPAGESRLALTVRGHALVARAGIVETAAPAAGGRVLVGQSYYRGDDRWDWDGGEQQEKTVRGEFLAGVAYGCRVVVSNPTGSRQKLAVLLQVPRGSLPVAGATFTRTRHVELEPYGTASLEYGFYFPAPGSYPHFPAHVTRAGEPAAAAESAALEVLAEPAAADDGSWSHVSQRGSTDEVLAHLTRANLGRTDLGRVAWRMRERDAFERVTALLAARHAYDDRLWAYALLHRDRARAAEWLRHRDDDYLRPGAPVREGALAAVDPVERGWYRHLEYAPLVNARAHQLGARRTILNDALEAQYRAFLDLVAHRARPTDDDLLAAAHYLFAMDRADDALAALARVRRENVAGALQYDYVAAYGACCRGDLAGARAIAAPRLSHPVDRWRHRFAALVAMLDEAEGGGAAAAGDPDSREQRMNERAAREPALELSAEGGKVVLAHQNLAGARLGFYRMDIELLFSRQPFVQGDVERFGWIEPGHAVDVAFGAGGRTEVPLPDALRGANLVIEAVAPGLRRATAHYAHDLAVEVVHAYGQVRVLRASTRRPLAAVYVKAYARSAGGAVNFFKDGYTDLRGRFDYATLSTDDLDRVERFAILVASDDAGATVLEAPPPQAGANRG